MKILIVEDSHQRIHWFMHELEGHDVKVAMDAETGKALILKEKYDIIFLDHDLGDRAFVDSDDPNTGFQVAKVQLESINLDTETIVHSLNPVGAQNIKNLLPNCRCQPFGSFGFKKPQ